MATTRTGAVKVLVVDDERAVRESLDRALRLSGYEVALAADGLDALRRRRRRPAGRRGARRRHAGARWPGGHPAPAP